MAEKAFLDVIENGKKIILDHHLVYHARQSYLLPFHSHCKINCPVTCTQITN
jgi:hypothetical protein